ncbi:MAG: NAD(P)-dependent oxidoreductase [Treponema sp.]|nr:NAD(P)-dependent oxidoreductase [Treponema sp.]
MNIVISGASGYLGHRLAGHLCSVGHHVLALTRTKNGRLDALAKKYGTLEICELETDELFFTLSRFNPDVFFSTTCCYETDTRFLSKTVDSNYIFPAQLLKYAMLLRQDASRRIRFISLGTSLPGKLNLYSLTKKQFGELGAFFAGIGRIQFVNVLLESFYGPDEPESRFIKSSILKLARGEPLEATEGTQHRDYILTDDVVDMLSFLAVSDTLTEDFYSVPVGTGSAPAIREILDFLKQETGSRSSILYGARPMRKDEPSTCADLTALRMLGYGREPLPWRDGMRMMINKITRTGE